MALSLARALDAFLLAKEAEHLSLRTIHWYRDQINAFIHYYPDKSVRDVRASDIQSFLVYERRRGLASSSVSARYRALQAFFNWIEDHFDPDISTPSPFGHGRKKAVRKPKASTKPIDYVRYEEFAALLASIPSTSDTETDATWLDLRDRCLVLILFWSGLRLGEVADLHVKDIDLRNGVLTVRSGKGDKGRIVPTATELSSALLEYLMARPQWHGPELWLSAGKNGIDLGGVLKPEGIRQILKRRCKRARMRYIHPHAWRHGFAMAMLNHGADMSSIANMLGHASETVTASIYAHWLVEGIKREYNEVSERIRAAGKRGSYQR